MVKHLLRKLSGRDGKLLPASVFAVFATSGLALLLSQILLTTEANSANSKACVCDSTTSYNTSLPSSHPTNRCAEQSDDVSWGNWVTGNSRSSQFHFIDLLELIHGHKDKPLNDMPTSGSPTQISR
ncbi:MULTISPECIES: hypothetical protein [Shewanella]|uniref:Uncharacterized protein n=1 Tax=Shewanella psychromarinicola TaxID=2487742 RepID=A0A3N4EQ34_9GAMM|nr:hypothetical protein [Shewanella psychromarinicola]AZG33908.1 hypothetical protein EGC80_02515 [Shewanella psychromarinicola]MCL1080895.1 hypothetical protein [Shewanella psychromarinicola]RPA31454.1 hypothetical protein EGC77_13755 [Shewanella psychromarinicola]